MAHQIEADAEGNYNTGDNISNGMKAFLLDHNISVGTIEKLVTAGLNTIHHLKEIEPDDFNEIAKDCGIKALEKVKLKTALKALKLQHDLPPVIIAKEERLAFTTMDEKIKSIQNAMDLLHAATKDIDEQVDTHKSSIKSIFKALHVSLNKREVSLIQRLHDIATDRKTKLQNASDSLSQQHAISKQKRKECSVKVAKETQLHQMESRIKDVLQITQQVESIEVPTKHDSIFVNNKIDVSLDGTSMSQTVNSFGDVLGGIRPKLMSTSICIYQNHAAVFAYENRAVCVKWKLIGSKPLQNNNTKLKVEWTETKTDDVNHEQWHTKQVDLISDRNHETVLVHVENKIAMYLFRIQYFDGSYWSPRSGIKTMSIEDMVFEYESDFDTNGIIYFLGSDNGKNEWQNPAGKGVIKIESTALADDSEPKNHFIGREAVRCLTIGKEKNEWFSVDFKRVKIKPTHYTLRQYVSYDSAGLRTWEFQGRKNERTEWITIKNHINDKSLAHKGASHTWKLDECNEFYSVFRIQMTGKNGNSNWGICCSGFEIYGHLRFAG
eukprot:206979_1